MNITTKPSLIDTPPGGSPAAVSQTCLGPRSSGNEHAVTDYGPDRRPPSSSSPAAFEENAGCSALKSAEIGEPATTRVVPLRDYFGPDINMVTPGMKRSQTRVVPTTMIPLSEVARSLGYRDSRNFRLSVAPRLGLPVVAVGLRWFATEENVIRVFSTVNAVPVGEVRS